MKNETILIVDDSPEMIQMLGNMLPKNIKRQVALNGPNALKLLSNRRQIPDLILLDVIMPEMSGYQVCEKIKKDPRLQDIPIIFISSLTDTFDKVKAFKAGAVDYITKPFQKEEVLVRINTHLEIASSRKTVNDLYSKTLQGTISAMSDMLAIANPGVSRGAGMMKLYSENILKQIGLSDTWDLKLACVLSGLGMLSDDIQKQEKNCQTKDDNINIVYQSLTISSEIISKIPRLQAITHIIENATNPIDESYRDMPAKEINPRVLKGHILRVLIYYFHQIEQGRNFISILDEMENSKAENYCIEILKTLEKVQRNLINEKVLEISINELEPGMMLVDDLICPNGRLMLKAGHGLSREMIILIKNFQKMDDIVIKVIKS